MAQITLYTHAQENANKVCRRFSPDNEKPDEARIETVNECMWAKLTK